MRKDAARFISYAIMELLDAEVTIHLAQEEFVHEPSDGIECNGFFSDNEPPEFYCALGKPFDDWFYIFIHEFCHFEQWRERIPLWFDTEGQEIEAKYFNWITGELELSKRTAKKYMQIMRALELDCEKRATEKMKEFKIQIDIEEYTKRCNAYVFFYNYTLLRRKWYSSGTYPEPYRVPEILAIMPSTFLDNYDKMPKGYPELVDKYCFGDNGPS